MNGGHVFPELKQNFSAHKFKDDRDFGTVVIAIVYNPFYVFFKYFILKVTLPCSKRVAEINTGDSRVRAESVG
jgi:hypothetical protein